MIDTQSDIIVSNSVVIPAHNVEGPLSRALKSVLQQQLAPSEIIVIDDGSTDGTADVVKSFGDRVTYVYQQNAGASAARNHGIRIAKGDWISFLDADDEWLPKRLQQQHEILQRNPELSWITGQYFVVNEYSGLTKTFGLSAEEPPISEVQDAMQLLGGKGPQWTGAYIWTGTITVRRQALLDVTEDGEQFMDSSQRTSHDLDLWMRLAARFQQIGYVYEPIANYHVGRSASLSSSAASAHDRSIVHLTHRGYELSKGLDEPLRSKLLRFINRISIHCCQDTLAQGKIEHGKWLYQQYSRYGMQLPWQVRVLSQLPAGVGTTLVRTWRRLRDN